MPSEQRSVAYTPEFKRNLCQLSKKYQHIRDDIQPIIDDVISGGKPGDRITGVQYEVFKVRVRNSDARRGKSGGYRIIYQLIAQAAVLITIYSKSEQADIAAAEIRRIIEAYDSDEENTASSDESDE